MARPNPTCPEPQTRPIEVENTSFMLERLGEDCAPLQFLRELTQNAIESVQRLPDKAGEVVWDVDWTTQALSGATRLCVIDNGDGMTGDEMVKYINALSSSISQLSRSGNYGVGAKIAAAPRNRAGIIYLSWKAGTGSMVHLWRDPSSGTYGLRRLTLPNGETGWWASVEDDVKPAQIDQHGTMVVLLGENPEADTMAAPEGALSPSRWVSRYLNTRYFRFPEGVTVKAREGWQFPRQDKDRNILRCLTGQRSYLDIHAESKGVVDLDGAAARWWILKDGDALSQNSGFIASSGHVAALYQDELYEPVYGRQGVARLQAFGVVFGHNRVVIYVEPCNGVDLRLTTNTARTQLLIDGETLPWSDWASEFREHLPHQISELVDRVAAATSGSDHKQTIKERLRTIADLFRFSKYRPTPRGGLSLESEGGVPAARGGVRGGGGRGNGGAEVDPGEKNGVAGDVYSLFLAARGIPGEEMHLSREPDVKWVSTVNNTRTAPDLEDRAAKFLPQQNLIQANADFRVFNDMIERWCLRYHATAGARETVRDVVREWFEQQLVEAVLGAQALRNIQQWTLEDVQRLWSEEALTAAVLPRYHVDIAIKRALGSKLGTLKERAG